MLCVCLTLQERQCCSVYARFTVDHGEKVGGNRVRQAKNQSKQAQKQLKTMTKGLKTV